MKPSDEPSRITTRCSRLFSPVSRLLYAIKRRLAAILAADVAGYSRLMGADEIGTLAALYRFLAALFCKYRKY